MASLSPTSVEVPAPLRVYDVADPHRHGTIIKAGPEEWPGTQHCERYLRPVGTSVDEELTRSIHPEEAVLHRGREAWNRLRTNSTWEDWKAVGKPQDIAKVIVGKLTKSKAEKVAREILKMLSGASRDA